MTCEEKIHKFFESHRYLPKVLRTTSPFANSEKRDFGLLCVRTVGVMVVVGSGWCVSVSWVVRGA